MRPRRTTNPALHQPSSSSPSLTPSPFLFSAAPSIRAVRWMRTTSAGLPALLVGVAMLLSACGTLHRADAPTTTAPVPAAPIAAAPGGKTLPSLPPAGSGRGGYYQDDGPGDHPPQGLYNLPDADPQVEPFLPRANRPYVVFGKTYTPLTEGRPFTQRGYGSWYGKKFHGQRTSSGEIYDMYKMTAAHPTLPIPSYARVTNLANGKQVIVRINDRGPFLSNRIIDLSYTAALKLGYLGHGSAQLQVDLLLPDEIARIHEQNQLAAQRNTEDKAVALAAPSGSAVPASKAVTTAAVSAPVITQTASGPAGVPSSADAASTDAAGKAATSSDPLTTLLGSLDPSAPAPDAPTSPGTVAVAPAGYYVQLGAFAQNTNAEEVRARLAQQWPARLPPVEVVKSGTLFRIQSGPFSARSDADAAARALQNIGRARPVVVQR